MFTSMGKLMPEPKSKPLLILFVVMLSILSIPLVLRYGIPSAIDCFKHRGYAKDIEGKAKEMSAAGRSQH